MQHENELSEGHPLCWKTIDGRHPNRQRSMITKIQRQLDIKVRGSQHLDVGT